MAKRPSTGATADIKLKAGLKKLAGELNEIMGVDPPLDVSAKIGLDALKTNVIGLLKELPPTAGEMKSLTQTSLRTIQVLAKENEVKLTDPKDKTPAKKTAKKAPAKTNAKKDVPAKGKKTAVKKTATAPAKGKTETTKKPAAKSKPPVAKDPVKTKATKATPPAKKSPAKKTVNKKAAKLATDDAPVTFSRNSYGIELMGEDPNMTREEYCERMLAKGYTEDKNMYLGRTNALQVIGALRRHGNMD